MAYKPIIEEGIEYTFDRQSLYNLISKRKSDTKMTKERIMEDLADSVNRSIDSVKKWLSGANGPDPELIESIALFFDVPKREFLKPIPQKDFDFTSASSDEKNIVIYFHSLLSDFMYTYLAPVSIYSYTLSFAMRKRDSKTETISDAIARVFVEAEDYFYNLYKHLDHVALLLQRDTYDKLHRIITECKTLYDLSNSEGHFSDWPFYNKRWGEVNPSLGILLEYFENQSTAEDILHEESTLLNKLYIEETGLSEYIEDNELQEQYIPPAYVAIPREVAKTLTLLFREDFKTVLNK